MMNSKRLLLILWALILLVPAIARPVRAQDDAPLVLVLRADGAVTSTMAEYLDRGLRRAINQKAEALIFMLNTPGGSVDITNRMIQSMRNSSVPIIVYVAPRGAMAGSAGTVLTLAGHVAVMAPETAIGAASPVGMQGETIEETLERKQKEILRATVRSLAEGRPPEAVALAEDTIESARAVSSLEAFNIGMVDFIANDLSDLLAQLDGFTVHPTTGARTLDLSNALIQEVPNTFIEQVLNILTNPNIVFLLLTIGVQSLLIEISSPGGWMAGIIGVVSLTLAVYGLGLLPVNWFGLVFIALSFGLFFLELKTTTNGVLTAGGVVSLVTGALILFNSVESPGFQPVSVPLVITTALLSASTFIVAVGLALKARSLPIRAGQESFVGRNGVVRIDLTPRGQVQVAGELWTAEAIHGEAPINSGERIVVVDIEGLRLKVRRLT